MPHTVTAPPQAAAPGASKEVIAARDVSVVLGGRPVLEGISLSLAAGEIVTLIGPNGAGKTTLARVMLGLERPSSGSLRRRPGLRTGYLPQRLHVDPVLPLTVRRFLCLGGGHPRPALAAVLKEVGAEGLMEQPLVSLSGGELQRVGLARALLRRPELLVLDEPLQGVDFTGQLALFSLIDRVRRERGCAVLLVSHDLHLVMAGTERVVCLNRHVCCSGVPDDVSQHPEYLALFGPRAAERLAVYHHEHDHGHDLSGEVVPLSGTPEAPCGAEPPAS